MAFFMNKGATQSEYLIVGLGNPGKQYEKTRHNAGFMAIDGLLKKYPPLKSASKFSGELFFSNIGDKKVIFLKPQTYMNLSGDSVSAVMKSYKIPVDNLVVIFDDITLNVGKLRIRESGTHGGHNGIKDIILKLGTDKIKRIKIGVGERPDPNYDLADWVLSRMTSSEIETVEGLSDRIEGALKLILDGNMTLAQSKFNG